MKNERISDLKEQAEENRVKQYPVKLAEAAAALARARGVEVSSDEMVCTLNSDSLGRPEMFVGAPTADGKMVSSERFTVYDGDTIRAYGGDGSMKDFLITLGSFVSKIVESRK